MHSCNSSSKCVSAKHSIYRPWIGLSRSIFKHPRNELRVSNREVTSDVVQLLDHPCSDINRNTFGARGDVEREDECVAVEILVWRVGMTGL